MPNDRDRPNSVAHVCWPERRISDLTAVVQFQRSARQLIAHEATSKGASLGADFAFAMALEP